MATPIIPRLVRGRLPFQTADALFPVFAQPATVWSAAEAHRLDLAQPVEQQTPLLLHRCDDCALDLGRDILRALGACPRWGKPRHGVESRCPAFVAKGGVA